MGNDRNPNWLNDKNWKPQYSEVLTLTIDGLSAPDIAKVLHMGENTVHRIVKSDLFQKKLGEYGSRVAEEIVKTKVKTVIGQHIEEARRVINEAAYDAAMTMSQMARENCGGKIQFMACKDILDRAGLKPIEVVETRERVYSPDEVASAKRILEETQVILERLNISSSAYVIRSIPPESSVTEGSDGKPVARIEADKTSK